MGTKLVLPQHVADILAEVRSKNPLVHSITNFVAMNFTANALLALDALPMMAHAAEEVEEIAAQASVLSINIGTLDKSFVDSMYRAGRVAQKCGIPIVFDPLGAGSTKYRTNTSRSIIKKLRPTIICGNGAEIASLYDLRYAKIPTINCSDGASAAIYAGRAIATKYNCVVIISGVNDYIVDRYSVATIYNGSPLMTRIIGMGCTAAMLVSACAAVCKDPFLAAVSGMAFAALAGEQAANEPLEGIGDYQIQFLNKISFLNPRDILNDLKLEMSYHPTVTQKRSITSSVEKRTFLADPNSSEESRYPTAQTTRE